MMLVPFVTFWGVGFTLDIQADYLVKLGECNIMEVPFVTF